MIAPRRAILRGLATLPLIGGGVEIIGRPIRVFQDPPPLALAHYANWLLYERRILCHELAKGDVGKAMAIAAGAAQDLREPEFHFPLHGSWRDVPMPSTRALLVMAAVGFDWRNEPGMKRATALQTD